MTARDLLARHMAELAERVGINGEVQEADGHLFVVLEKVPLPSAAFLLASTDVLFIADYQYPLSAPDMFWTSPEVLRPDGTVPKGAEWVETYLGRRWRRFSWHRQGAWRPTGNRLLDHFALMEERFAIETRQRQFA